MSTTLVAVLSLKLVAGLVVWLLAAPFADVLLDDRSLQTFVALFGITLFTNALIDIPIQYLRALDRPKAFVAVSLIRLFSQLTLNVIFVVFLERGVLGVIQSSIISGLVIGVPVTLWSLRRTGLRFAPRCLRAMAGYSWPLLIAGCMGLYIGSAPRVFLTHQVGLFEVGLLALALQIAAAIDVFFAAPFNQSIGPLRFQLVKQEDGKELFRRIFGILVFGSVSTALGAAVFAEEFIEVMAAPAFWPAATLVAPLALARALETMVPFLRTGLLVEGRTFEITRATFLGAVVLSIALFLMLDVLSVTGAALAILIAQVPVLWWTAASARKSYDPGLEWRRYWIALLISGVAYAISFFAPEALLAALLTKFLIWVSAVAVMYFSPVLGSVERQSVRVFLRNAINHVKNRKLRE